MSDAISGDPIKQALADLAAGKPVVVVDDEDLENEGDLIFAAEKATPELVSFMVRYTSGYICVALTEDECDRLDLPPMHHTNSDSLRTAFTVTVDAKAGITTGISAADRAHTIRLHADSTTNPNDLVRPGHVLPLRARAGGVLRRPGHTEASVDLARLAGLTPAGGAVRDRVAEE
jgi:3,4-dihydroxy 2-butanone 4-phosphate synthase/GTP cyclohydrolase II